MTTQDKISQLALLASLDSTAIPSATPKKAKPAAPPASVRVSPWATPSVTREYFSPVPLARSHDVPAQDLRALFSDGRGGMNRKRCHSKPPLGMAMLCFLTSTSAVLLTSASAESGMAAMVPEIRQFASDYESVMAEIVAREQGLKDLGLNVVPGH